MSAAARVRPDPRPMRLAIAAGAVAAVSAMAAGAVRFDTSAAADPAALSAAGADPAAAGTAGRQLASAPEAVTTVIRYVHLKPGQHAPPGARVITPDAPAPRLVVTRVAPHLPPPPQPHRVVTRQSGRP